MLSPQVNLAWYRVLKGPGKPGKFWIFWHFLGLEGPGKRPLVLEKGHWSWKGLEMCLTQLKEAKCMEGRMEN